MLHILSFFRREILFWWDLGTSAPGCSSLASVDYTHILLGAAQLVCSQLFLGLPKGQGFIHTFHFGWYFFQLSITRRLKKCRLISDLLCFPRMFSGSVPARIALTLFSAIYCTDIPCDLWLGTGGPVPKEGAEGEEPAGHPGERLQFESRLYSDHGAQEPNCGGRVPSAGKYLRQRPQRHYKVSFRLNMGR